MKIAFLIYSLEKAGGSERVTVNIANKLQSLSYDVTIITLNGSSSFFKLENTVKHHTVDQGGSLLKKGLLLVKYFNSEDFDCIVSISVGKLSLYLAALSFFLKGNKKLIASEHLALSHSTGLAIVLKKIFYKRFSKVIVLTDNDLKVLKSYNLKNAVKISNASSYYPNEEIIVPVLERQKVILAAGRLEYQKGFDLLIKAWAIIYKEFPEWKLKILGEGSLKKELQQLIDVSLEKGACEIVPFDSKMNEYYNSAQVFALSSRFEGLPMVLIEAFCYGCPIISYDCETGPGEIITDGSTGFLIKPQSIDLFSTKLYELLRSDSLRMGIFKNQMLLRSEYSIDNIIKHWCKILNSES